MKRSRATCRAILAVSLVAVCLSASAQRFKDVTRQVDVKCDLLTEEDAAKVLRLPLKPPRPAQRITSASEGLVEIRCRFFAASPKLTYLTVSKAAFGSEAALRYWLYGGEAQRPAAFQAERGLGGEAYSWRASDYSYDVAVRKGLSLISVGYHSTATTAAGGKGDPPSDDQIARMRSLAADLARNL